MHARTQMLARLGYVALAADIYGAAVRPGPQEAPAIVRGFYDDPALVRARAQAGATSPSSVSRATT